MKENRLLNQFQTAIKTEWTSCVLTEDYKPLNHRELFELAYHTANSVPSRNISMKISQDDNKGGHFAILYHSKKKRFIHVQALEEQLQIAIYTKDDECNEKKEEIKAQLSKRKNNFAEKDKKTKSQLLKIILVERKIDDAVNLVMLRDISRKVYFAIGDARESAAVVPLFMEAEGASLVQLALNKWMTAAQRLPPEEDFPDDHVKGLIKNMMQIKRWVLKLVTKKLDS
ncbi:MAG: putative selenocysteine system protein [Promethearchaeia archaeon]